MSKDPKASYYDVGGIETLDIIKAKLEGANNLTPYQGYLLGCIIKYATRLPYKEQLLRDAEKINTYTKEFLYTMEQQYPTAEEYDAADLPPLPPSQFAERIGDPLMMTATKKQAF